MPGSGKSVLAKNLALDAEVLARFSDGVLWVTVGQAPDLLASLNLWIAQLGGTGVSNRMPGHASSRRAAAGQVRFSSSLMTRGNLATYGRFLSGALAAAS